MFKFYNKLGIFNFIEETINVKNRGLEKGKDFEIVSFMVFTEDFDLMSIESYQKSGRNNQMEVSATPYPAKIHDRFLFFKLDEEIDKGLASNLGLGVVQMLTGEHAGEELLYLPFYGDDKKWDDLDLLLVIQMYLQLKHPEVYFKSLDSVLHAHADLISTIIAYNPQGYMSRLHEIFSVQRISNCN